MFCLRNTFLFVLYICFELLTWFVCENFTIAVATEWIAKEKGMYLTPLSHDMNSVDFFRCRSKLKLYQHQPQLQGEQQYVLQRWFIAEKMKAWKVIYYSRKNKEWKHLNLTFLFVWTTNDYWETSWILILLDLSRIRLSNLKSLISNSSLNKNGFSDRFFFGPKLCWITIDLCSNEFLYLGEGRAN